MADTANGSITPPPPERIHTPPTPRLGYHDNWEPFTPRKSARISSQRATNRTPSPSSSYRRQAPPSPRTVKKTDKHQSAFVAVPHPSPQKKRQPALDSVRRATETTTAESSKTGASLRLDKMTSQRRAETAISSAAGMLPTPSKTPSKAPSEKTAANIKSFARNLFASDAEALPTPKKRTKKYTGISLESFTAEDVEEPIEIFTDSQDRVPTKDDNESNPFIGESISTSEPAKRRTKRKQILVPGEGVQTVDAATQRKDGMVYIFRGKKFFRRFAEKEDDELEDPFEEDIGIEARLSRPLTRSSIKPRLLFPTAKKEHTLEDEEASTDVEEADEEEEAATDVEEVDEPEADSSEPPSTAVPQTPVKPRVTISKTPEAPKFAPMSPPDTRRTTRSTNKLAVESKPIKPAGRRSPFDSWLRTKEVGASGTKRQAEAPAAGPAKRTRI